MNNKQSIFEGDVYQTNNCGKLVIVKYERYTRILVRFINTGREKLAYGGDILKGNVRDNYSLSVLGVGYIGNGVHRVKIRSKFSSAYNTWVGMLSRCYNPSDTFYLRYGGRGIKVCDEWHCFQTYADWFFTNIVEGFHVDKDLKLMDSKLYSPSSCEFIPPEINTLLVDHASARGEYPVGVTYDAGGGKYIARCSLGKGCRRHIGRFTTVGAAFSAYKVVKEARVKEVAQHHYDLGEISKQIYDNLMAWEVNIDD